MLQVSGAALFPYDPQHQTFVNVYENGQLRQQAILDKEPRVIEFFSGTRQGAIEVIRRFLPAGIHHILIGPDHILFLIGLILLGGTLKRLLLIVTAFTLAHSVTLSVAALGLVNPPSRVVEPAIALSIIYVGADNILGRGGRDVRAWIAFAFGLVHGFGFSSVLRELGLPTQGLLLSLFGFNAGVELGQAAVVAVALPLLALVRKTRWERRVIWSSSAAILLVGVFLFVDRAFS
jgi:hydrogenase/urease accessory protein HupE